MNPLKIIKLNLWLNPFSHLLYIIKWHLGFALLEFLGATASTLASAQPRRVLIIGTGPSLDKLSSDLLSNYDTIVAVNYALVHPLVSSIDSKARKLFWMSLDNNRCMQLALPLSLNHNFLPLYVPNHHGQILKIMLNPLLRFRVTVLKISISSFTYSKMILGVHAPTRAVPVETRVALCKRYIDGSIERYPPMAFNSGLAPIPLFARLGARVIHLIGCDNSPGSSEGVNQSSTAIKDLGWKSNNVVVQNDLFFRQLKAELAPTGVELKNLSWEPES